MRIFENFLIIGLQDTNFKGETKYEEPQILYAYVKLEGKDSERLKALKDFCFPSGI